VVVCVIFVSLAVEKIDTRCLFLVEIE